ncbi:MAG: hypothetical protein HYZ00_07545, partial [Candidatus Hydrogenedentes bacterium]|nr:hypothetical protein [Candidatus Hydrogenedentota bacterium]
MRVLDVLIGIQAVLLTAAQGTAAEPVTFEKDVRPIFEKKCFGCHSPQAEHLKAKLDLSTAALALKGGEEGPDIVPGDVAKSRLVQMIEWAIEPEMPPKGKFEKLPEAEIEVIKQWIAGGALSSEPVVQVAVAEADKAPAAEKDPAPEPGASSETPEQAGWHPPVTPISAAAFSPDGALFARGSLHTVEVLSADPSGALAPVRTLEGHAEMVRALDFSPDGALLAAAGGKPGRGGEVRIWKVASGELLRTIEGHRDCILDTAISPDGAKLATCGYDKLIKIWALDTGAELQTLKDHVDAVFGLDYSPDGKLLASCAGDRTVKIWNAETGERLLTLSDATDAVLTVAFDPTGKYVAAGAADKMLRIWDVLESGAELRQSSLTTGVLVKSA